MHGAATEKLSTVQWCGSKENAARLDLLRSAARVCACRHDFHLDCTTADCRYMLWGMMRAPTVPTARGRAALGSRGRTSPEVDQYNAHAYGHTAQAVFKQGDPLLHMQAVQLSRYL